MIITVKQDALVILVGAIATGKSSFAAKHFASHHIVETDYIRSQVTGDFENQDQDKVVFEIFFATVDARAKAGILTVLDSTGNQSVMEHTKTLSKKYGRPVVVIKFPELNEDQITPERFQHRWKYKGVYTRQVKRINEQVIPAEFEVYELTDLGEVCIGYETYADEHTLSSDYSYVVIPDLHGECSVLKRYIDCYKDDDNVKFISLGDIVDRGESSYKTFNLVYDLIADGKLDNVISNHDNKFYRYLQKWKYSDLGDSVQDKDSIPLFGMSLAHGLKETIWEFYQLTFVHRQNYCERFIAYYESSHPYLVLNKPNGKHFFTHAGISSGVAIGQKMTKRDLSALLYETVTDPEVLTNMFKHVQTDVHVHVGHDHYNDTITFLPNKEGTRWIVKHDIGLGKIPIETLPEFMLIA